MTSADVSVWVCANDEIPPTLADTLSAHWLDEHEGARASRFVFERDRRQYLVAHLLVRRLLSLATGVPEAELRFWRSPHGRPFVHRPVSGWPRGDSELDFNLSHADGYNVVAMARNRRVGVDVERLDRVTGLHGIAETFTPTERRWLVGLPAGRSRDRGVLRLWTLKEAYAKARGLGLALPFDSFGFVLGEDRGVVAFQPPADDPSGFWWFTELEPVPAVLVALAVEITAVPVTGVQLHAGFPWRRSARREILSAGPATPVLACPVDPRERTGTT